MKSLFYAAPLLTCFDDEGSGKGTILDDQRAVAEEVATKAREDAARADAAARQAGAAADEAKEKAFSQEDVNTFLADDRRKHKEKYQALEENYTNLLGDNSLAAEQREKLQASLSELQKKFRTKEQQAEFERKEVEAKYSNDLKEAQEDSVRWETMFKTSSIQRSLQDAAIASEAFNPSQIVNLLEGATQMQRVKDELGQEVGDLTPMVDFMDVNETTGDREITLRTPADAVKRMKELSGLYGNLFKANVVSGIGSGAATGGAGSPGGTIDLTRLSPEAYRRIRAENPELLGLKRNREN